MRNAYETNPTVAGALAALALTAVGVSATGAQAAQAGTCTGKTDGICLYRDASGGVWGWVPSGRNIINFMDWNYASTTQVMNDSISSYRNPSTCYVYLYWDYEFQNDNGLDPIIVNPGAPRTYVGSLWNDEITSLYWNC